MIEHEEIPFDVLVVEDEYFIAHELENAFREIGASVVGPVATREKAREIVSERSLGAAVLDIKLRGEMVFAIADELEKQGVPFIFASGYDPVSIPSRFAHVPYWEKPFDVRRMAAFVRSMYAKAHR